MINCTGGTSTYRKSNKNKTMIETRMKLCHNVNPDIESKVTIKGTSRIVIGHYCQCTLKFYFRARVGQAWSAKYQLVNGHFFWAIYYNCQPNVTCNVIHLYTLLIKTKLYCQPNLKSRFCALQAVLLRVLCHALRTSSSAGMELPRMMLMSPGFNLMDQHANPDKPTPLQSARSLAVGHKSYFCDSDSNH